MTPFKALYGRDPPTLTRYEPQASDPPALQEELLDRDRVLQQLKNNLQRAQQYMKKQADKNRNEVTLQVGELVLVKLQPYRQQSVALRKNNKLGMRYFGPFEIIARVGEVAYKLKLPDYAKIHPVFHVSQLKPFKGVPQTQYMSLPLTMTEVGPIIYPKEVLQARMVTRGSQKVQQVLIQCDQADTTEATWEDMADLQQKFPSFNLEDKVVVKGDGIVMKPNEETSNEAIQLGPQNVHGNNTVRGNAEIVALRRGMRSRKTNTMLKDFVNK
jgi:hypothetical protein